MEKSGKGEGGALLMIDVSRLYDERVSKTGQIEEKDITNQNLTTDVYLTTLHH